jgi:hypothetical protein
MKRVVAAAVAAAVGVAKMRTKEPTTEDTSNAPALRTSVGPGLMAGPGSSV